MYMVHFNGCWKYVQDFQNQIYYRTIELEINFWWYHIVLLLIHLRTFSKINVVYKRDCSVAPRFDYNNQLISQSVDNPINYPIPWNLSRKIPIWIPNWITYHLFRDIRQKNNKINIKGRRKQKLWPLMAS